MSDADLDSHPTHAAYMAGKAFARKHPKADSYDAKRISRDYDDSEAFMEGFYECVEDSRPACRSAWAD